MFLRWRINVVISHLPSATDSVVTSQIKRDGLTSTLATDPTTINWRSVCRLYLNEVIFAALRRSTFPMDFVNATTERQATRTVTIYLAGHAQSGWKPSSRSGPNDPVKGDALLN